MTASALAGVTAVVMAKAPVAGAAKTRLQGDGTIDGAAAAVIAEAMLACTVTRLLARTRVLLAVTPDGAGPALAERLGRGDLAVVDQGDGTLGARIDRVWRGIGPTALVAFFGGDSPDVPAGALDAIGAALATADAAIGPTGDGGYWTLAARGYHPALVREIDWGGRSVYDQTCRRAAEAGLELVVLPAWFDVDRPDDLRALRSRLASLVRRVPAASADSIDPAMHGQAEAPLRALAERLDAVRPGPDRRGPTGPDGPPDTGREARLQ